MGSDWGYKTLGEIISLQRGHDLPSQNRSQGTIPIIGSSGFTGLHDEYKARGPGVVVGRSGNSMGVVSYSEVDFWPLNTCLYITDFKGNDPRYIYYLLKQVDFDQFNSGSAQKSLNRNFVYPYKVFITSDVNEQFKIGELLSDYEKKISLNREINQTLEQMAQALFKSWFVDFDPVIDNALDAGFFDAATNSELNSLSPALIARAELRKTARASDDFQALPDHIRQLFPSAFEDSQELSVGVNGWVPKGWESSNVENELTIKGGSTPSTKNPDFWEEGYIHWTTPKDLSGNTSKILLDTDRKISEAGLEKITSGLLPENTVLMSSRAPVGYLAFSKIPIAINQGYIAIPNTKRLSQEFVIYWLDSIMEEVKGISGGTTFAEISKKTFRSIKIIVPEKNVIEAFSSNCSNYLNKVAGNIEENNSLIELRDKLLPKLISGELRLDDVRI